MHQEELVKLFDELTAKSREVLIKKNRDYANEDSLSNFKMSSQIAGISPEICCLSQIAIKVSRLGVLLHSDFAPINEAVEDTALDLFVYSFLLRAILKDQGYGRTA